MFVLILFLQAAALEIRRFQLIGQGVEVGTHVCSNLDEPFEVLLRQPEVADGRPVRRLLECSRVKQDLGLLVLVVVQDVDICQRVLDCVV